MDHLVPLSQLLPSATELGFSFSSKILVSPNFFQTHETQGRVIISPYMKPVDTILFIMHSPDDITACLLSNEEANDPALLRQITHSRMPQWLSTTNYLVLAGQAPEGMRDNLANQELLEQIRFFAGKFSELVEQKTAYAWLQEEAKRKFEFYEAVLRPWREYDLENFEKLKASFSRHMVIFREMSNHPFQVYTEDFDWEELDPDITPADIHIFQSLGRSYQKMNRDYWDYAYNSTQTFHLAQQLKQSLRLPAIVLGYVMQHLNKLAEYQATLKTLITPYDRHYSMRLTSLTGTSKQCIENILGLSIAQVLQQYGYDAEQQAFCC